MILPAGLQQLPIYTPGISPGQVIRLTGRNLGPGAATRAATPGVVSSGSISTGVAGIEVTFDGIAAPLLSLGAGEIDCIAPFEIGGHSATTVQVQTTA